ncbi:hypothetical protein EDM02_02610 [Candidatus Cardinium hertigii]|uniref:Uncharacterized protein n=2 Tax=Candidatus Cardinium hertigii TaxID=247481 RepID=A0A3N2QBW8_9BACT|nr:hypothetical protein EDM02_02610 [Candidatus Cardinium hertigii]
MKNLERELNIDKGNETIAQNFKIAEPKHTLGKETPSVLIDLLAVFEEFSRNPLPAKKIDFYQRFLPELITWVGVMYDTFSRHYATFCSRSVGGTESLFFDPHLKGQFLSPYCMAFKKFQDCIDTIFANIAHQYPGVLKEGQALSVVTWEKCAFESFTKLMKTIQNHCQNTTQCQEWNEVKAMKNATGEEILNGFSNLIMHIRNNGSQYTLLWRKEAQHYVVMPLIKSLLKTVCLPTLWTSNDRGPMSHFIFSSKGEIERRAGILINFIRCPDDNIVLALYDGMNSSSRYQHRIPSKKEFLEDLLQLFFGYNYQKRPDLVENTYSTFIPLPNKIDDVFDVIGEIIHQEIHPGNKTYEFLDAYFHLSESNKNKEDNVNELAAAVEETSVSRQMQETPLQSEETQSSSKSLKKIQKSIRKKQQKEETERTKQQERRHIEKFETLHEKAKITFPELIKLINIFSKLNPEVGEGTVTQKGSHTTMHSAGSKSITIVKSHGKQKGNELSKKGTKQFFKDFEL